MSPVPPAMSRIASPVRGFTRRTNWSFHSRCMPARHQVVHQIVARGDAGEDAAAPAASSPRARRPRSRKKPCPSRRASSRGWAACAHRLSQRIMPELPEVETTVRGLAPGARGPADRLGRAAPRRSAPAVPARPAPAADRRAGHRPRPARQIWPDRHRPRRHVGLPPRHVGPLADRSGRDRHARPCPDRDRRGAAAGAQRSAPLRLARPRRDRRARRVSRRSRDGPGAARRRRSTAPIWRGRSTAGRAPIKALLLDQRIVAGLGNIYVCEALQPGRDRARRGPAGGSPAPGSTGSPRRSRRCCSRRSRPAARRCATMPGPTASSAISRSEWRVYGREGRGLSALRRGDSPAGRFGPLDLLLPELPALSA